jgi:hypothetical protein
MSPQLFPDCVSIYYNILRILQLCMTDNRVSSIAYSIIPWHRHHRRLSAREREALWVVMLEVPTPHY